VLANSVRKPGKVESSEESKTKEEAKSKKDLNAAASPA
jgi:hypothetical protein